MANWFVDDQLATGNNDGTTMDHAWQSILTALEYTGFTAGDKVWLRRRCADVQTGQIDPTFDAVGNAPLWIIGWPRNSSTGTGSIDQGERVMYGLGTISADKEKHLTRNIKVDANGTNYMISAIIQKLDYVSETGTFTEGLMVTGTVSGATGMIHKLVDAGTTGSLYIVLKGSTSFNASEAITDTDTGAATTNGAQSPDGFALEMRYVGTDVSSGAITIEADTDYTEAQAIVDTTWTIKKTDYNADADDLPKIDFTGTAFYLYDAGGLYRVYRNVHIIAGTAVYTFYIRSIYSCLIEHCLIETTGNTWSTRFYSGTTVFMARYVVWIGSGTGTSNVGIAVSNGVTQLEHFAIYNFGDFGVYYDSYAIRLQLTTGTIGVMLPNGDDDLFMSGPNGLKRSRDVEFGGAINEIHQGWQFPKPFSELKGYQQILGDHMLGGETIYQAISTDVVAGSGDPQKRSGGADKIITWPSTSNDVYELMKPDHVFGSIVLEHHIKADTSSKSYRYYVQAEAALGTEELILFCEYVDEYHAGTGAYHRTVAESSQSITLRSGATDWSQYVEVTGIQPAKADEEVRLWIQIAGNGGNANIHIDPQVVIS